MAGVKYGKVCRSWWKNTWTGCELPLPRKGSIDAPCYSLQFDNDRLYCGGGDGVIHGLDWLRSDDHDIESQSASSSWPGRSAGDGRALSSIDVEIGDGVFQESKRLCNLSDAIQSLKVTKGLLLACSSKEMVLTKVRSLTQTSSSSSSSACYVEYTTGDRTSGEYTNSVDLGETIAVSGHGKKVIVHDLNTQLSPISASPKTSGEIRSVQFSKWRNEMVLAGGGDGSVTMWDTRSMKQAVFTKKVHSNRIYHVSSSGPILFSASADMTVQVRDIRAYHHPLAVLQHDSNVYCLQASPNMNTLVTGGHDESIRVFDLSTFEEIAQFSTGDPIHCLQYDDARLVIGQYGGQVKLYSSTVPKAAR